MAPSYLMSYRSKSFKLFPVSYYSRLYTTPSAPLAALAKSFPECRIQQEFEHFLRVLISVVKHFSLERLDKHIGHK